MSAFFDKIRAKYRKDGLLKLLASMSYWSLKIYIFDVWPAYFVWPFARLFGSGEFFTYDGKRFKYFFHPYNKTWTNERAIEIPIIRDMLRGRESDRVMEIGNVSAHYFFYKHTVVDLYEKGENVINQDAADIRGFESQFDLIYSISTFEHIGWDCGELEDGAKIGRAIASAQKCLKENGKLILTVPIGYNKYLDALIGEKYRDKADFMLRTGKTRWEKTDFSTAIKQKFNHPFNAANALAVIKIAKI